MDKLHIAIIMDGNGRWATAKNKKRVDGHKVGSEVVRKITTSLSKNSSVSDLTLYAFSTENWKRPKMEVDFLMQLLATYLNNEIETYLENGVRFRAIGDLSKFSSKLQKTILRLEDATKKCSNLTQNLALNYGGKDEIVRAIKKLLNSNQSISEKLIEKFLDLSKSVDILIRTGGDLRISNFLIWQITYAELFFTKTLWPDFTEKELFEIIKDFHSRERRFGGLSKKN
jgi:undecaprenyl diphosphate synthase